MERLEIQTSHRFLPGDLGYQVKFGEETGGEVIMDRKQTSESVV